MATNDTFYRKTKIFVIKSLEVLEEIKDRGGIPLGPPQKEISIEESSGGGIGTSSRFIQKTDFSYFIFNNWKKIKKRLEKAYSSFGERIKYVGPDCGLGPFPNQERTYLVLKNTSAGIKAFLW